MAGRGSRLIALAQEEVAEAKPAAPPPTQQQPVTQKDSTALTVALLVLQVFSQRMAAWLGGHTLPLTILGIGAALWWRVLPDPSIQQLVGLATYAAFGLLLLLVRR